MPPLPTPAEFDYDNSPQVLGITGSFFAIAAFIVLLRCYVRIAILKVFGIGTGSPIRRARTLFANCSRRLHYALCYGKTQLKNSFEFPLTSGTDDVYRGVHLFQDAYRLRPRTPFPGIAPGPRKVCYLLQDPVHPVSLGHGWNLLGEDLNRLLLAPPFYTAIVQSYPLRIRLFHCSHDSRLRRNARFPVRSNRRCVEHDTSPSTLWKRDREVL
jgi:hypothetical protein